MRMQCYPYARQNVEYASVRELVWAVERRDFSVVGFLFSLHAILFLSVLYRVVMYFTRQHASFAHFLALLYYSTFFTYIHILSSFRVSNKSTYIHTYIHDHNHRMIKILTYFTIHAILCMCVNLFGKIS